MINTPITRSQLQAFKKDKSKRFIHNENPNRSQRRSSLQKEREFNNRGNYSIIVGGKNNSLAFTKRLQFVLKDTGVEKIVHYDLKKRG